MIEQWCSLHGTWCSGCMIQRVRRFMISTTFLLVVGFFLFAFFASIDKAADYLALGVEWLRTVTDARR